MDARAREARVRHVLWVTLWLNLGVSGTKVLVGMLTGSLAMVADGYHSLVDAANNVVGLVVLGFAAAPPDDGHPYGHRKFETSAALLIGLGLISLAYQVGVEALGHVSHGAPPPAIGFANWTVMIGTLGVNLFVARYEGAEGRRLGSDYLQADAAHTGSDVYVTLGVLASFAGTQAGLGWFDGVVAAAIAGFIAVMGMRIVTGAFHVLTDRAVLASESIAAVVLGVPGVLQCRDIRTRGSRAAIYVDLVVHMDGAVTLQAAHEVADRIEAALKSAHPRVVDVVVHVEPA